jgi:hypothetical protein
MNKKIKKLWVSALRSGKYKQGKEYLYGERKYCCLGVLSKLAVDEKVCSRKVAFGENEVLTKPVMKWANLRSPNPKLGGVRAVTLNDEKGKTFPEIADLINKNL